MFKIASEFGLEITFSLMRMQIQFGVVRESKPLYAILKPYFFNRAYFQLSYLCDDLDFLSLFKVALHSSNFPSGTKHLVHDIKYNLNFNI